MISSIGSSATRSSTTSSAVPRHDASKLSLPSMSASVSTTLAPVALATRLLFLRCFCFGWGVWCVLRNENKKGRQRSLPCKQNKNDTKN